MLTGKHIFQTTITGILIHLETKVLQVHNSHVSLKLLWLTYELHQKYKWIYIHTSDLILMDSIYVLNIEMIAGIKPSVALIYTLLLQSEGGEI